MKPYSIDLRERVLADRDAGLSAPAVAAKDRASASWVRRRPPTPPSPRSAPPSRP